MVLGTHSALLAGLEARKGNCRVETISYTGDGVDGQDQTHRLTFSKRPDFVLIFGGNCIFLMPGRSDNGTFIGTYEGLNSRTIMPSKFVWEGSTAVLNNPKRQVRMDATGVSYQAIAWIPLDTES